MQLKRRKVIQGLEKLDGVKVHGGNHINYKIYIEGKFLEKVPVPNNSEFGNTLINFVAKPLSLNNKKFHDICICHKDREWYCEYLESRDKI